MIPRWKHLFVKSRVTVFDSFIETFSVGYIMSNSLKKLAEKAFSPRYLFFTNTALGTTFYTAADLLEQKISNYVNSKKANINLDRSSKFQHF